MAPPATAADPAAVGERLPVTVVIPAHNRASMVRRALGSVAAQRPQAVEVIVVDDASSDDTAAVAESMGARVVRHERNRGEGVARNSGVAAATQPWIALLDSDDEWLPHHLDHVWRLRNGHVLVAASILIHAEGPDEDRFSGPVTTRPVVLGSPAALLHPQNFVAPSATMIRRSALLDAGGYRADLVRAADLDLLLRVLERGTGIVSPRVGALYHEHAGQVSRRRREMRIAHKDVAAAYGQRPWADSSLAQRVLGTLLWDDFRAELRDGRTGAAVRQASRLAGHPQRAIGLAEALGWRYLARRRVPTAGHSTEPIHGLPHATPGRPWRTAIDRAVEALLMRALDIRAVDA